MQEEYVWKGKGPEEMLWSWLRLEAHDEESKDNHERPGRDRGKTATLPGKVGRGLHGAGGGQREEELTQEWSTFLWVRQPTSPTENNCAKSVDQNKDGEDGTILDQGQ